jgi:hypothetical protein
MRELSKQERNSLMEVVKVNGIDASRFEWGTVLSKFNTTQEGYVPIAADVMALKAKSAPNCLFTFEDDFYNKFAGTMWPPVDGLEKYGTDNWNSLLNYFGYWLHGVQYELDEPDLWKTPFAKIGYSEGPGGDMDAPFTEKETTQVRRALRDIQRKFSEKAQLEPEPLARLEASFARLEKKLDEHISKFDFKNILLGTLFHIYVAPWIAPYADVFKDTVMQYAAPLLNTVLKGLALK